MTWTSGNPNVVSLSTDDPPILTALAAGHVTIVAGTAPNAASADVTVFAGPLPIGTVIWSNPGDGSGVNYIVPAVPSTSGVADVFAFQADGTVQAITSDGTVAWTADLSQARYALPDFQGGLAVVGQLLAGQSSIYKLDGTTGQPYPAYTASGTTSLGAYGGSLVAVHPDGTIFAVQQNSDPATYSEWDSVIGIDPTTGAQKFSVDLHSWPGFVWDIMIAGDGYAYVVSSSRDFSANTSQLYLLRVNSSGAYDDFGAIYEWVSASGDILDPNVGMITNADQGILLTWSAGWGGMALTAGTGVSLVNPPAGPGGGVVPILQAQDGSFVGSYYNDMVAFDASGNTRWIVPNETPQIATADGGVIGQSGMTYDQNGNATGQIPIMVGASPIWAGQIYAGGGSGAQADYYWVRFGVGFWSLAGGNPSGSGTSAQNLGTVEGHPKWKPKDLPKQSVACALGTPPPVSLTGTALTQYRSLQQDLGAYLTSLSRMFASQCSVFFATQTDPFMPRVDFAKLMLAVANQVPFDGLQSVLSEYAAGIYTTEDVNATYLPSEPWPYVKAHSAVCSDFWYSGRWNTTVAVAQTLGTQPTTPGQPPFTGVYIATLPLALKYLTQSTILHESLHNLTGYSDEALYTLLTGHGLGGLPTQAINDALVSAGCAQN